MPTKPNQTSTALVPDSAAGALITQSGFSAAQVDVVRRLFARGATSDELAVFLRLAAKYDLDPLAREIWCICELDDEGRRKTTRTGEPRPPLIQASRAGWRKVAQRGAACAGIEAGAVYSKDSFHRRADGGVDHQISLDITSTGVQDRGKIVGAYALVWRRDWQRPAYAWASWADYGAGQVRDAGGKDRVYSPWYKYPSAMIEKQAESMALRQAFPLGALAAGDDRDVDDVLVGHPLDVDVVEESSASPLLRADSSRVSEESTARAGRKSPRSASSLPGEGAARTADDAAPAGASSAAPGGEEHLFAGQDADAEQAAGGGEAWTDIA